MIRTAICDDELWCRETLRRYCQTYFQEIGQDCMITEYPSGEELREAMTNPMKMAEPFAELLLLDIEMPGIDGIQLKELLQAERRNTRILFVTSHREAMPEAFGSRVLGFLEKPVEYGEFQRMMDRVMADIGDDEKYVIVENVSGVHKVYLKQIRYIQGDGKYTRLYLKGEADYLFSEDSLGDWKERLEPDGFFLCHKSYLVNFYHVKAMKEEILLSEGGPLPISRRMRRECVEQYRKYLWKKARAT